MLQMNCFQLILHNTLIIHNNQEQKKKTTFSSDIISIKNYNNKIARSNEIKSNTIKGNTFNCFDPKKDEQEKLVFKEIKRNN